MPPKEAKKRTSYSHGSPLSPSGIHPAGSNPRSGPPPLANNPAAASSGRRPSADLTIWSKVQSFSEDDHIFLTRDFESVSEIPKKLDYYNIIYLFNPRTKSRPSHNKPVLKDAFLREVRPLLLPYLLAPPSVAMETDGDQLDFNPLDRKTTRPMLSKAIAQKAPDFKIPSSATIDDILIVYKFYVDKDLAIPVNNRFTRRPRIVNVNRVKNETIEDLLLALRYFAPSVFVRSLAMNKECLMAFYLHFVHDVKDHGIPLIPGFHYTILEGLDTAAMEEK